MPFSLQDIEQRVLQITTSQLGFSSRDIHLDSRFIEDLGCDSLEIIELFMTFEREFQVEIPNHRRSPLFKSIFTRRACRIRDIAEVIFLLEKNGPPNSCPPEKKRASSSVHSTQVPFSQLGGRWDPDNENWAPPLFEPLEASSPVPQFRRRSDGMRCLLLPAAEVEIGSDALDDEAPVHQVQLDSFLIDAEPISTTAFCRFLNSIHGATEQHLADWFVLPANDDRQAQLQISLAGNSWEPLPGTERMPMVLVSWFAACAYSRWANEQDWRLADEDNSCFLPSEAQWEYAARGTVIPSASRSGDCPFPGPMNCNVSQPGTVDTAASMPLAAVNDELGMSPFGLHHMGGNVWQWCRDWYDEQFYSRPEANERNPVNQQKTGIRSERGGSWVGPAELCRSSYRRGRVPTARGRCLGFRCISFPSALGR